MHVEVIAMHVCVCWAGVYLWILGQADVMLADAEPSAKTAFDYEIYMKECHLLWGQGLINNDIIHCRCEKYVEV